MWGLILPGPGTIMKKKGGVGGEGNVFLTCHPAREHGFLILKEEVKGNLHFNGWTQSVQDAEKK